MNNIHIIAEAGTNHAGALNTAQRLIDIAVEGGADSVKFQIIYPEGLYLPRTFETGEYVDNPVFQQRQAMMLPDEDYDRLAAYCADKGIAFSASIFDQRGIDLLDRLQVPFIKIASCDLNNARLLQRAAATGRKLIVSTGMASLGEVEEAVESIVQTGHTDLVLMHCVSVYPVETADTNLDFIDTLKQAFGFPVGFSDHTENNVASILAVSKGVTWLEKHITYDRQAVGFDHRYAMEPEVFASYVSEVRKAEQALQRAPVKIGANEANTKVRARRGLYAARDIPADHVLTESDILVVRPEGPLRPNDQPLILTRRAKRVIRQYEALALEDFA